MHVHVHNYKEMSRMGELLRNISQAVAAYYYLVLHILLIYININIYRIKI